MTIIFDNISFDVLWFSLFNLSLHTAYCCSCGPRWIYLWSPSFYNLDDIFVPFFLHSLYYTVLYCTRILLFFYVCLLFSRACFLFLLVHLPLLIHSKHMYKHLDAIENLYYTLRYKLDCIYLFFKLFKKIQKIKCECKIWLNFVGCMKFCTFLPMGFIETF